MGGAAYSEADSWTASIAHRWQYSDKHYVDDVYQRYRTQEGSQVINDIHTIDVGVAYQVTKRFGLQLGVPYSKATRSQGIRDPRFLRDPVTGDPIKDANGNNVPLNPSGIARLPDGSTNGAVIARYKTSANGLGDIKLLATGWILDPEKFEKGNISLGLGVLFPTGESDHKDIPKQAVVKRGGLVNGAVVQDTYVIADAPAQNVDNSIQPGSGAWGIIFDIYMFRQALENVTLFASGTYIATPQADAGVLSGTGPQVWSTGDAYLARAGAGYTFWPSAGLTFTLAARAEGSPSIDLIGSSAGRRRPGYAVSIEPGLVWAKSGWAVSFSTPVAIYRNRTTSFGTAAAGDAAFADFMTLLSVSKHF